jgi:uridine phosphorylase
MHKGITATAWFYGPQGRVLRLNIQDEELNLKWIILNGDKINKS